MARKAAEKRRAAKSSTKGKAKRPPAVEPGTGADDVLLGQSQSFTIGYRKSPPKSQAGELPARRKAPQIPEGPPVEDCSPSPPVKPEGPKRRG